MRQTFPETFTARSFLRRVQEEAQIWIMEAATDGSLDQRMQAVCQAVRTKWGEEPGSYTYAREVFDGYVIVQKGDALWRVDYTVADDGTVTIADDLQKVKQTYVNVSEGFRESLVFGPLNEDGTLFVAREGVERPTGRKWGVFIIQEGMSKNRNRYARKVLTEAAPLYEGRPVYLGHYIPEDGQPQNRPNAEAAKVGFLKDVRPVYVTQESANQAGRMALAATLVVTRKSLQEEMLEAWEEGHEQYGLSHDAFTEATIAVDVTSGGKPFYDVTRITKVESVDLVTNPAAGGRLLRMVASNVVAASLERDGHMFERMIRKIRESGNAEAIRRLEALGATPDENGVWTIYDELLRTTPATPPAQTDAQRQEAERQAAAEADARRVREAAAAAAQQQGGTADTLRRLEAAEAAVLQVSRDGRRHFLEAQVAGTTLPDAARQFVRESFEPRIAAATALPALPTEAEITESLRRQVEMFGRLAEGGLIVPSTRADIRMGDAPLDKAVKGLDLFFGVKTTEETLSDGTKRPKYTPVAPDNHRSFREIYVTITGDTRVTGQRKDASRLTEGLSAGSFDQILGDSITRRMVAEYQNQTDLNSWRQITRVVSLSDYRTQRRMRFGGYGNLSIVAERAPYPALASPTDEEVTYAPAKRGGTESISIEAIKNDDVGVVREIPTKLARAALQTLYEFVWDFLNLNATIYDSVALAASGHNNLLTTALSASQISAGRLLMVKQTDMNNSKRLALTPKNLIIPADLAEMAFQITGADRAVPDTNLAAQAAPAAPNFVQRQGLQTIVVSYWTDTNNWWLTADMGQSPMIEVGFVDGQEDPQIFVSDLPNAGSLFTNDVITWKLKHAYGGGVLDFRPFVGAIVP